MEARRPKGKGGEFIDIVRGVDRNIDVGQLRKELDEASTIAGAQRTG
jgi:hypothetical protein